MTTCDLTCFDFHTADKQYDIERIMIGNGKFYMGLNPIAVDATLQELGLYNRDGMIFRPEFAAREIMSDQHSAVLRTFMHTKKLEIQFKLIEIEPLNLLYAFGSPDYAVDVSTGDVNSLCINGGYSEPYYFGVFITPFTWNAVGYQRQVILPKLAVKNLGEIVHKAEEETKLDLTMAVNLSFDCSGYENKGILFGVRDVLATV